MRLPSLVPVICLVAGLHIIIQEKSEVVVVEQSADALYLRLDSNNGSVIHYTDSCSETTITYTLLPLVKIIYLDMSKRSAEGKCRLCHSSH